MEQRKNRPYIGVLLFASPRFRELGVETNRGKFGERKQKEADALLDRLRDFSEVVFPGIIYSRETVKNAIKQFTESRIDCVFVHFLSWSEDFAWIRFLRDMPDVPIIFSYIGKKCIGFENTRTEDDFIEFLGAGGLVGALEASGSIERIGRKSVKIISDTHDRVIEQSRIAAEASRVIAILKESTFGLLAGYNELMWSTYVDPYNFFVRLGPELKFIPVEALKEKIEKIDNHAVDGYMEELRNSYGNDKDEDPAFFKESVRASIGIAEMMEELNIHALALNDVDHYLFKQIGLRPGFYHPRLSNSRRIVVPEADLGGAFIVYVLKQFSSAQINFIEPFFVDEESNTFTAGHAGPNDYTDRNWEKNVRIAEDVRFAGSGYKYAGAPFAWYRISPGLKTLAHFSECRGRYKIIAFLADSLEGEHIFSSFTHSVFKPSVSVYSLFEEILNIGSTQHFACVDGDYRQQLKDFASLLEITYHEISS